MVNILCRLHHNNASRKVRDRGTNYCICIHLSGHNICTTSQESSTLNKVKLEDNHFHSELFQFLFVFHCSAQCSLQIARHVNGHLMDCLHT